MDKHIATLERLSNAALSRRLTAQECGEFHAAIALMRGQSKPAAYLIRWKEHGLWRVSVRLQPETNASMREATVTPLYELPPR